MQCPKCHHNDTRVLDSRETNENREIRRRRACSACKYRFTTFERLETNKVLVIKKNKTRETYSREKLKTGIWKACEKRPVSETVIDNFISELEENWAFELKKEISTREIGQSVMDFLKNLDDIAYIRFASVYRQFRDLESFKKELQKLLQ